LLSTTVEIPFSEKNGQVNPVFVIDTSADTTEPGKAISLSDLHPDEVTWNHRTRDRFYEAPFWTKSFWTL
jgi:hypothetical protein